MVMSPSMGYPVWLLALAVLCGSGFEVKAQCQEYTQCEDLSSEKNIVDCLKLCTSGLTEEFPFYPGDGHLQPLLKLVPSEIPGATLSSTPEKEVPESGTQHQEKRSYSMEHFRWGKPVGRKRRPIKIFSNGVEEESDEALPAELEVRRELATCEAEVPPGDSAIGHEEKKDGTYKMSHFRFNGPPNSKRHGGFINGGSSWDERSQKPLLTLFKNIINKDGQQKKDH